MDKDIVPGLLELIESEFDERTYNSEKIKNALIKLIDKKATYKDANEFAIEVGEILSEVFNKNITVETLPDGRMYYNIADRIINPTMSKNYELISGYAADVQTGLNNNAGLKIKGQKAELNQSRINGIIERISKEDDFNKIKWILNEPIINFSQSIIDDTIRTNAEFHSKVGLQPKIIRRSTGKCCDWCEKIVGVYDYADAPEDIYRRHRYCKCTVDYDPGDGRKQNVWTKEWTDPEKETKIEARKKIGFKDNKNAYNRDIGSNQERLNLQLFAEKDLDNQDIEALRKGIKSLEKQIENHNKKITNPEGHYLDWNNVSPEIRRGRLRHWKKEISNFEKSIANRKKIIRRKSNE